jgi:hypothetical protein
VKKFIDHQLSIYIYIYIYMYRTATTSHGRRAMLTGDVLTRSSRLRAGIFLDDNDNDYRTQQ